MATCEVPYSEAALRRVDHYFEVRSNGGAEQFRARQNQTTTQDCVLAGACLIDGIIAIGYRTGGGSGGGGGGNTGPGVGGCNNMATGAPGTGTIASRDYTTLDCPGGGGDGSEGGYTYVPMSGYDMVPDTAGVPDCSQPQPLYSDPTLNWGHAYCRSSAPAGVELDRTLELLNNLEARGGVCAEIASFGRALLNRGKLRYYSFIPEYTGVGGWGSPALGALLDVSWITNFSPNDPNAIAKTLHEIEHAMGQGHVIGPLGYNQTPNEQSCAYGGFPSW